MSPLDTLPLGVDSKKVGDLFARMGNSDYFCSKFQKKMEKKLFALKKLLSAVEKVTDEVALPQLKELLHKPDRKTLDRLSLLAGFQDWDSFQDALHGDVSANENYSIKKDSTEG